MSSTTHPLPAFMRKMTPAKFKAMSKDDQRAYRQKAEAWLDKMDAGIEQRNAKNHKNLAFGVAKLIADNRSVEWDIVSTYLEREDKVAIPNGFFHENPRIAEALASYELRRIQEKENAGKPKRAKKTS